MNYLPVLFGYEASNIGNSHVALSLAVTGMKAVNQPVLPFPEP